MNSRKKIRKFDLFHFFSERLVDAVNVISTHFLPYSHRWIDVEHTYHWH